MAEHDVVGVGRGPQDRLRALVAEFRKEVNDKLAVVYHRGRTFEGADRRVMAQCEDFLVEQFESALAALDASREPAMERCEHGTFLKFRVCNQCVSLASQEAAPFPLPWRYDSLAEVIYAADGSFVADFGHTDDNRQDAAAQYIVALANQAAPQEQP